MIYQSFPFAQLFKITMFITPIHNDYITSYQNFTLGKERGKQNILDRLEK